MIHASLSKYIQALVTPETFLYQQISVKEKIERSIEKNEEDTLILPSSLSLGDVKIGPLIVNYGNLYFGLHENLNRSDVLRELMNAIKDLRERIEHISIAQDELGQQVADMSAEITNKKVNSARVFIYFEDEQEFTRALSCLEQKEIDSQIMGYGTIETSNSAIVALHAQKFRFGKARTMKEIYENTSLVRYWDELVEKEYGCTER